MDAARAPGPPGPVGAPADAGAWRVFLGKRCNNGCRTCPYEGVDAPPAADVDAALSSGRARAARRVFFVGGEPTLHEALPDWIARARAAGYAQVRIQTNGRRLAYRGYTRHLVDAGLHGVDVSLHGPRAAIHAHHTRDPDGFRQTVAGIGAARGAGLEVGVSSVVTRSSHRHLAELVPFVAALDVDTLHLAFPRPEGGAATRFDAVVPRLARVARELRAAALAARRRGVWLAVSGLPACLHDLPMLDDAAPAGVYGPPCADCPARPGCPGLSTAYAERFGFGEVAPPPDVLPSEARQAADPRRLRFAGT